MSNTCPHQEHRHCKMCGLTFLEVPGWWFTAALHMRDMHPQEWAKDHELRRAAAKLGIGEN